MKKDLPAVQKAYDLCKEVLPRVSRLPRDVKFTLGDRIVTLRVRRQDGDGAKLTRLVFPRSLFPSRG
jgi:hypothetical protein